MQESNGIPHTAIGSLAYAVSLLLSGAGGGTIVMHLLNRRRLSMESEANAAKTKAEARHLDSETIDKAYDRIEELHAIIDQLRLQRETDRLELLRLSHVEYLGQQQRTEIDRLKIELDLQEKQIKRIKGFVDAKGLKLSEMDEPAK